MLSRPEIGTRAHIRLWLAGKDPNEHFEWSDMYDCACGQYAREFFGDRTNWLDERDPSFSPALCELNLLARDCGEPWSRTFGILYKSVCEKSYPEEGGRTPILDRIAAWRGS